MGAAGSGWKRFADRRELLWVSSLVGRKPEDRSEEREPHDAHGRDCIVVGMRKAGRRDLRRRGDRTP